jgi:hypothetical protein
MDLSSGKVRHDIRDEKFGGHFVVPIVIDEQLDAGCLVLSDQVDGLGHRTTKPYDGSRAGIRSRFAATSASLRASASRATARGVSAFVSAELVSAVAVCVRSARRSPRRGACRSVDSPGASALRRNETFFHSPFFAIPLGDCSS